MHRTPGNVIAHCFRSVPFLQSAVPYASACHSRVQSLSFQTEVYILPSVTLITLESSWECSLYVFMVVDRLCGLFFHYR